MPRSRVRILLIVALVLALASPALAAKGPAKTPLVKAKGMPFQDVASHWASAQIQKMIGAGLFNGVSANEFDPDGQMTKAQIAVLLCRALGLEEQTEGDGPPWQATFKDEDKMPAWASNHIRVCFNARLMLGETQGNSKVFNPNKPLTRQEFVVLMARSVDTANENTAMVDAAAELAVSEADAMRAQFRDYQAIGKWALGYVALALREGWITGYNDRTFQPNKPVSRAETCTMLERLEGHLGHYWSGRVSGTIVELTGETEGIITLAPAGGGDDEDYTVATDCRYVMCGQTVAFGDLAAGMKVKLYITADLIVYVHVECDDDDEHEFSGTITALSGDQITIDPDDPEEGDPIPPAVYKLASTVIVKEKGEAVPLSGEDVGRTAELKVCYNLVLRVTLTEVEVEDEPEETDGVWTGRITAVDMTAGTLTVDPDEAADEDPSTDTVTYPLADDVEIEDADGEPVELSEDLIGRTGEFTVEDGEITSIKLDD